MVTPPAATSQERTRGPFCLFVIPFKEERYELYFEQTHEDEEESEPPAAGFFGRLKTRFQVMLRAAEERQRQGRRETPQGWWAWVQERMLAWVAERIAEQRLLWNLRRETEATAMHPSDIAEDDAVTIIKRLLKGDYDRHRVWLIIDSTLFVVSGVFFFVPGPNLIAYFFAFRLVGHWLSMRGASQGLHRIAWTGKPCTPLLELRQAATLEPVARAHRVEAIGRVLHLQHLTRFYERLYVRHARQ